MISLKFVFLHLVFLLIFSHWYAGAELICLVHKIISTHGRLVVQRLISINPFMLVAPRTNPYPANHNNCCGVQQCSWVSQQDKG